MSITQPTLTAEEITDITNYVNAYRQTNQAPPLIWDETIANVSQQWSFQLASKGVFTHSKNPIYGENLAYFQGYGTNAVELVKKAIDSWYNEISHYDFSHSGFSDSTGHFTCLVWVSSTQFGMGISINNTTNAVDIVFNTSPPGNVIGEFQPNVLPAIGNAPTPMPTLPTPPTPPTTPTAYPPDYVLPSHVVVNTVNRLKSIIYELQTRKRKRIIIATINEIIDKLANSSYKYINDAYNILLMVQNKQSPMAIISTINQLIIDLQT